MLHFQINMEVISPTSITVLTIFQANYFKSIFKVFGMSVTITKLNIYLCYDMEKVF